MSKQSDLISTIKEKNNKQKNKLLIVDDSSNNRAAIDYWLQNEGYEILHSTDGKSTLKIIEAFIPDIILLDYNLPDMDGIEVCQKIRANKKIPFIPIIMMSSNSPEAYVMALEQGADEFVVMPIMPAELKSRLKAMLRLKKTVYDSIELGKENKRLQELDKIKSNFISKVSHELKTPLQAILGYADILFEGLQGELNYPQKLMVKQIKDGGDKLLTLVNQLLDFESIESGKTKINAEVFYIASVFEYLNQVISPIAVKKNIKLSFVLKDKNLQLESDKNLIQKILLNLISNSIKFSDPNTQVLITAYENQNNQIEFLIQDHGCGIEKSKVSFIFDKFWQGDDSITRPQGGLGIGLALVKKLVAVLRGEIIVESQPHQGTTFKIVFPKECSSYTIETNLYQI